MGGGSRVAISVLGVDDPRVEVASDPRCFIGEPFCHPCRLAASSPCGVELAGLLKNPAVSVGMISWFIGVAMNLAGSVQYPV